MKDNEARKILEGRTLVIVSYPGKNKQKAVVRSVQPFFFPTHKIYRIFFDNHWADFKISNVKQLNDDGYCFFGRADSRYKAIMIGSTESKLIK